MKRKLDQHILDGMSKDLSNWHGPLYCNRKDPRLIVPKYNFLMGWTFNFSNPYLCVSLIAVFIIIIAFVLLF
ncbi:hypothetical protein [Labilibaculum sp.]|uniref:hypothetical protein n=1 Tax=Labilibaculum sp. TaxID=2060723 RepID=UPI0035639ECB